DLSRACRLRSISAQRRAPRHLSEYSRNSHSSRGDRTTVGYRDTEPRPFLALRQAPHYRPLDLADLAVCQYYRRGGVLDAVPAMKTALAIVLFFASALGQQSALGLFEAHGDVGDTPKKGSVEY